MLGNPLVFTGGHLVPSVLGGIARLVFAGVRLGRWIGFFFLTTVSTSASGYGFPLVTPLPSHSVGALSLIALAIAIVALYPKRLAGGGRRTFVILSVFALYMNVFVLVAQFLEKNPVPGAIAPDPKAPAFAAFQGIVLALFLGLGWAAVRGFRNAGAAFGVGR
jgi:hypothetical protein